MFKTDVDPEKYVEEHGMKQDNDEDALREIVKKVIEENPKAWKMYAPEKVRQLVL